MADRLKRVGTVLALLVAVVAVYGVALGFGYIRFDDADYTFACAFVRRGLTLSGIREAFLNVRHGGVWMPLTWLSYMVDISLFGLRPLAFHLGNLLWHALVVLLLFSLVRTSRNRFWALVLVLVWAVHPQRAEAVAWIAARKELVWSAFALLGLLAWRRGHWVVASLLAALASAGKPTAMAFPALVFALDYLEERPIRVRRYLPLVAIALATAALAAYSQTHPEGLTARELFAAPFGERVLNAAVAVGLALVEGLFPFGIHFDYRANFGALPIDWPLGLMGFFLASALYLAAVLRAGDAHMASRSRRITALAIWFFGALLPTLGIFGSFGEHARADRFLYMPMMALVVAFASCPPAALLPRREKAVYGAMVALAVFYAVLGVRAVRTYADDTTLFSRTLACDPDHPRALVHLGEANCAKGEFAKGVAMLENGCRLRPSPDNRAKLAYALMRRGKTADFERIAELCADFAAQAELDRKGQALEALGTAELVKGEWGLAADHLSKSVLAPARFYSPEDAQLKLAFALHNLGKRAEAMKIFEAIAHSSRRDLVARAETVIETLCDDDRAILFW